MTNFFTKEATVLKSIVEIDRIKYTSESTLNENGDRIHLLRKLKGRKYFFATEFKSGNFSNLVKV